MKDKVYGLSSDAIPHVHIAVRCTDEDKAVELLAQQAEVYFQALKRCVQAVAAKCGKVLPSIDQYQFNKEYIRDWLHDEYYGRCVSLAQWEQEWEDIIAEDREELGQDFPFLPRLKRNIVMAIFYNPLGGDVAALPITEIKKEEIPTFIDLVNSTEEWAERAADGGYNIKFYKVEGAAERQKRMMEQQKQEVPSGKPKGKWTIDQLFE